MIGMPLGTCARLNYLPTAFKNYIVDITRVGEGDVLLGVNQLVIFNGRVERGIGGVEVAGENKSADAVKLLSENAELLGLERLFLI